MTLYVLRDNGGVFANEEVTVVQRLGLWLENVASLPYLNVGDDGTIQSDTH